VVQKRKTAKNNLAKKKTALPLVNSNELSLSSIEEAQIESDDDSPRRRSNEKSDQKMLASVL
jgi:hypothetical protein